jgi:hypothetical protein
VGRSQRRLQVNTSMVHSGRARGGIQLQQCENYKGLPPFISALLYDNKGVSPLGSALLI